MSHRIIRSAAVATIGATSLVVASWTARADHVHSLQVGNRACVLLAQSSGEGDVGLPFGTDAQVAASRAHPLNLLVHLGQPDTRASIGVYGTPSDPCFGSGDYING